MFRLGEGEGRGKNYFWYVLREIFSYRFSLVAKKIWSFEVHNLELSSLCYQIGNVRYHIHQHGKQGRTRKSIFPILFKWVRMLAAHCCWMLILIFYVGALEDDLTLRVCASCKRTFPRNAIIAQTCNNLDNTYTYTLLIGTYFNARRLKKVSCAEAESVSIPEPSSRVRLSYLKAAERPMKILTGSIDRTSGSCSHNKSVFIFFYDEH